MTTSEKQAALAKIAQQINAFKDLEIARTATHAVPGEGNPDAQILFIGEAPGFNEDCLGRPFVGQAGKLLDQSLSANGLERSDVYITNVVKFRPPGNRDPLPQEITACAAWLDAQIAIISPRVIVTLGRFSMAKFIPGVTISRVHGQSRFVDLEIENPELKIKNLKLKIIVFPMYHPAAALRSTEVLNQFRTDFAKLTQLLTGSSSPQPSQPSEQSQTSLF